MKMSFFSVALRKIPSTAVRSEAGEDFAACSADTSAIAPKILDRALGCMHGCAIVDAIGSAVEFQPPSSFPKVTRNVFSEWSSYPNPHRLAPGTFTDDTSMALCLGASLLAKCANDPVDQITRYRKWWNTGYMSPTGTCFDIGLQTKSALSRKGWAAEPHLPIVTKIVGSNGCIMRLAPVPIACLGTNSEDVGVRARAAASTARTTHSTETCVQAAILMNEICYWALSGEDKAKLLAPGRFATLFDHPEVKAIAGAESVKPSIADIVAATYVDKKPAVTRGDGGIINSADVDKTLESALWGLSTTEDFASGALKVVNQGHDADTAGAVYGTIAGAVYGSGAIPEEWSRVETMRGIVHDIAQGLAVSACAGKLELV